MVLETLRPLLRRGPLGLLFATFCATSATASFMAYNFHEISPYVLIGNPLTLTIIEVFAVPGALVGTLLYPLASTASCGPRVPSGAGPDRRSTFPLSRPGRLFFSASRCFLPDRAALNSLKCLG
jgi:hypothetical protein